MQGDYSITRAQNQSRMRGRYVVFFLLYFSVLPRSASIFSLLVQGTGEKGIYLPWSVSIFSLLVQGTEETLPFSLACPREKGKKRERHKGGEDCDFFPSLDPP